MLALLIIIKIISYTAVVSVKAQSRIVNGTKAADGEFPFIASLRSPTGRHFCGSSILNEMWILTAAHCVYGKNASSISVQYGTTKLSKEGSTIVNVSRIVVHEGYDPSKSLENDVALLEMHSESPIVFNVTTQPVKLPEQLYEAPPGTNATLAGWGLQKSGGSIQEDLQKVELITFSDEECFNRHNGTTVKTQLCAGVPEGGKGQCNGDSGGPLIVDGKQLGIVSWSRKPCTVPPYPGVLTKVSHYVDWILKQISKEELCNEITYL